MFGAYWNYCQISDGVLYYTDLRPTENEVHSMNKTFKIVFNKARGALMVANEITGSVQKKGTKAVITTIALAAAGTAIASGGSYQQSIANAQNKQLGNDDETISFIKTDFSDAASRLIGAANNYSLTVLGSEISLSTNGRGVQAGSNGGTVNIGNSDVEAAEKLDAAKAAELVDHKVCVVTMAPIVNNDVTAGLVKNITKSHLTYILTVKITNCKEVGGADEAIVLITRPESSGTRATFKKYALDGASEASNKSMETDDSGVLLQNVKTTKGAIGYVALSYLVSNPGVDTVSIDGVEPTLENTYAGKYPVWTYEHMYTKGNADEVSQKFLDYITSDEYGKKMESLGYGVSSKMTVKEH